jgi:TRAP-type C4-dicarboxylate transport system substrate-binding protein
MKVRPAGSSIAEMVKLAGGTSVQASAPEARDAIERGVADEITFPWQSMFLFGIEKAVKYSMDVPLYTTMFTYNVNLKTYNSMSDAQKKVFDAHCTPEWASKVSDPWTDFEFGGRAKMKALEGHDVYKLTDDQLAQWKKLVEPLKASWADAVKKAGADPAKVDADLQAAIKKYGAGLSNAAM